MPELAEVEYFRKQWNVGLQKPIRSVLVNRKARVFRDCEIDALILGLKYGHLQSSMAAGKQMAFRTSQDGWLGIHLGMTGELRSQSADLPLGTSDHLVVRLDRECLVFSDPRMFGRVHFSVSPEPPLWWSRIPPAVTSRAFTLERLRSFLMRRSRSPIKAVLLMQDAFPGIGNWMADEILWRTGIHPRTPAGSLSELQQRRLHRTCRWLCRRALATIGTTLEDPPRSWLFPHRWQAGGRCPRTGVPLVREEIGGRTTCWSPGRQTPGS